jgi:glycosyltransferase involved in cell wall biosynthesis
MNILLVAYACEPNKGSEPEVGWQNAIHIANLFPNDSVYVITRSNNEISINASPYPKNIIFLYYDLPKTYTFWKKKSRGVRTYYYFWMIFSSNMIARLSIKFDVIHHITFVNDWLPSFFIRNKSKHTKFIWGPVGSNDPMPIMFLDKKDIAIDKIKHLIQWLFRSFNLNFYRTKNKADVVIGINENIGKKIRVSRKCKFVSMPAIAIECNTNRALIKKDGNKSVYNVLYIGGNHPIKNFKTAKDAFLLLKKKYSGEVLLTVVGSGFDNRIDFQNNIQYMGYVDKKNIESLYEESSIFLYPTLENAGLVILEAMSYKLPVVSLLYGGPASVINSNRDLQLVCIQFKDREQVIESLSDKLLFFAENIEASKEVGDNNYKNACNKLSWSMKANFYLEHYKREGFE